jgi:hypothetical protein
MKLIFFLIFIYFRGESALALCHIFQHSDPGLRQRGAEGLLFDPPVGEAVRPARSHVLAPLQQGRDGVWVPGLGVAEGEHLEAAGDGLVLDVGGALVAPDELDHHLVDGDLSPEVEVVLAGLAKGIQEEPHFSEGVGILLPLLLQLEGGAGLEPGLYLLEAGLGYLVEGGVLGEELEETRGPTGREAMRMRVPMKPPNSALVRSWIGRERPSLTAVM